MGKAGTGSLSAGGGWIKDGINTGGATVDVGRVVSVCSAVGVSRSVDSTSACDAAYFSLEAVTTCRRRAAADEWRASYFVDSNGCLPDYIAAEANAVLYDRNGSLMGIGDLSEKLMRLVSEKVEDKLRYVLCCTEELRVEVLKQIQSDMEFDK